MPLADTMFCAQQINIPPAFPDILKQFTKAAIRTQPHDVLKWSAAYFSALYKGQTLPVKDRLEMPVATQKTDTGLTLGLLKVLHKQLSANIYASESEVQQKWKDLGIPLENLERILNLGSIVPKVDFEWMKFLALACSSLCENLLTAMTYACEILTNDPPGGAAHIEFTTFKYLYSYLARVEGLEDNEIKAVLLSLEDDVIRQDGLIQPRNFTHIFK